MTERIHEEFDRQRLDDLYFEPEYDPDDGEFETEYDGEGNEV